MALADQRQSIKSRIDSGGPKLRFRRGSDWRTAVQMRLAGLGWQMFRVAMNDRQNVFPRNGHFFFMAGKMTSKAFGWNTARTLDAVLSRLLVAVRLQQCNCLEVESAGVYSLTGIPYVRISGHARNGRHDLLWPVTYTDGKISSAYVICAQS